MKVVLIKMPFLEQEYIKFSEKWEYIEDEYVGIGIVEAILRQHGCDVRLVDAALHADMCATVNSIGPDVVMISVMQTSARLTYKFVNLLRKEGYHGKIFIGGWFAKMAWREIFRHKWPVDHVCFVDAEDVLPQWIENSDGFIQGIADYGNWQQQNGRMVDTRTGIDRYISPCRRPGRHTYSIETSRGCPHSHCTFCSQSCGNILSGKWRPIPLHVVRNEIVSLYDRFGVSRFATSDDDLLGPESLAVTRAENIRDMMKSISFPVSFCASISVRSACSDRILDALQEAGLEQLCVGFESADAMQLRRYGKQQTLEENFIASEKLLKRKIKVLPGLITFDPYSTVESIGKNLDFLFDCLRHYNLSKLTKRIHLLTGTPFVNMCKKDNLITGDYLEYEYRFKNEGIKEIYDTFNAYVDLVKDIEKQFNCDAKAYENIMGPCNRRVARHILQCNRGIDRYILDEIRQLKDYLSGEC